MTISPVPLLWSSREQPRRCDRATTLDYFYGNLHARIFAMCHWCWLAGRQHARGSQELTAADFVRPASSCSFKASSCAVSGPACEEAVVHREAMKMASARTGKEAEPNKVGHEQLGKWRHGGGWRWRRRHDYGRRERVGRRRCTACRHGRVARRPRRHGHRGLSFFQSTLSFALLFHCRSVIKFSMHTDLSSLMRYDLRAGKFIVHAGHYEMRDATR